MEVGSTSRSAQACEGRVAGERRCGVVAAQQHVRPRAQLARECAVERHERAPAGGRNGKCDAQGGEKAVPEGYTHVAKVSFPCSRSRSLHEHDLEAGNE